MRENKYLIFMSDKVGVLPVLCKYINNGHFKKIYKDECNFNSIVFRAIRKSKTSLINCFFDKWKNQIETDIENIIIFDSAYNENAIRILKKKCKNSKIILYYWNYINEYSKNFLKNKNIDEFWTFDIRDSKRYKINYNPQFYTRNINLEINNYAYDVLFLGRNKNRKEIIYNITNILKEKKIEAKNIIIENKKDFVPYEEYLQLLSKTRVILDIVDIKQVGLTLRCMESIFFNKKLITNNLDIENYDFYNPNNIFIIGKDNINNIKEFIDKPYEPIDEKIVNYYDFEQWLERFGLEY